MFKLLSTTVMAINFAVLASGQIGDIRSVVEYRVKIDRAAEFVDLQKQFAAELKKANAPRDRYVFQLLSGPRAYIVVTYFKKWADLDTPPTPIPAITGLLARINSCVESSERRIDVVDRSLTFGEAGAIPNLIQVTRTIVRREKINEYLALSKNTAMPAFKKAGVKRRIVARVRLGGPSNEFISSVGLEKWADLDGPNSLQKGLGEAGYQDFLSKLNPLVARSQFDVYRYLRDASYVMQPAASGGN